MESTSWAVRRKRKISSRATPATKRVRLDDASNTPQSDKRQSTLTQIQFVQTPPPSFYEDDSLKEIRIDAGEASRTVKGSKKSRKPRSTLTQMDWLSYSAQEPGVLDEELLIQAKEMDCNRSFLPQVDGAYESPRKPRKDRKRKKQASSPTTNMALSEVEPESQYLPAKKSKNDGSRTPSASARRRSNRLANMRSLPSDPKQGLDMLAHAMYENAVSEKQGPPPVAPRLEVKDTFASEDDQFGVLPQVPLMRTPQPYRKRDSEVLSSQTPQSIRTVRKVELTEYSSPTMKSKRSPLQNRSANLPTSTNEREYIPEKLSSFKTPSKHKTSSLKTSSKTLLPRQHKVEDSQQDIYSIQPTSSPVHFSELESQQVLTDYSSPKNDDMNVVEIPASSQCQSDDEAECLPSAKITSNTSAFPPDSNDLVPKLTVKKSAEVIGSVSEMSQSTEMNLLTHHGIDRNHLDIAAKQALEDRSSSTIAPLFEDVDSRGTYNANVTREIEDSDADSDLGSPRLNDTQFNDALRNRTSSPAARSGFNEPENSSRLGITRATRESVDSAKEKASSSQRMSPLDSNTIGSSASNASEEQQQSSNLATDQSTGRSPSQQPYAESLGHGETLPGKTRKVLLNDLESSSPLNESSRPSGSITQPSIRPASMPRPSQMSTQDPTQGWMLSSLPDTIPGNQVGHVDGDEEDENDHVTVKDSSSPTRLSQIPQADQIQKATLEIGDSEKEDDDLDLDCIAISRNSARKPLSRSNSKVDYQFESIHQARRQGVDQNQGFSSPPLTRRRTSFNRTAEKSPFRKFGTSAPSKKVGREQDSLQALLDTIPSSPDSPVKLKHVRKPIPGLNNETQSDFTQNGHVTAAYYHKKFEQGLLPEGYEPQPYQIERFRKKGQ